MDRKEYRVLVRNEDAPPMFETDMGTFKYKFIAELYKSFLMLKGEGVRIDLVTSEKNEYPNEITKAEEITKEDVQDNKSIAIDPIIESLQDENWIVYAVAGITWGADYQVHIHDNLESAWTHVGQLGRSDNYVFSSPLPVERIVNSKNEFDTLKKSLEDELRQNNCLSYGKKNENDKSIELVNELEDEEMER